LNITMVNVNRPPSIRIDSPLDNMTFSRGQRIYFDAWTSQDPDEANDGLTFIWHSSKQGLIKQGRGIYGAQFSFENLKFGRHIITLTVRDSDGGETSMNITVKVMESTTPAGSTPEVPTVWIAIITVCVFALGVLAFFVLGRRGD
jgi:hypothetical protein